MSDDKSRSENQGYMLSEKQHTAWERTRRKEAFRKAVFHLEVRQGYKWSDAFHVLKELSPGWTRNEVEEIIKKGMVEKLLKEAEQALEDKGVVKNASYVPPDDF